MPKDEEEEDEEFIQKLDVNPDEMGTSTQCQLRRSLFGILNTQGNWAGLKRLLAVFMIQ